MDFINSPLIMNRACIMFTFCVSIAMLMVSLANGGTPKECNSYKSLSGRSRNIRYSFKPRCDNKLQSAWYRFKGGAGKEMATSCPPVGKCSATNPGWLPGGPLPSVPPFRIFTRVVCFRYGSNCCKRKIRVNIRHCGDFFVYKLSNTSCYERYCGSFGAGTVKASLTADDQATIWVNQVLVKQPLNNKIWNKAQTYVFPENLRVVAVAITNTGGRGGLLASFDNGVITDSNWRCSESVPLDRWTLIDFDDSVMPRATVYGGHSLMKNISSRALWIGTHNRNARKMYCRWSFKIGTRVRTPKGCLNYAWLTDPQRAVTASSLSSKCDNNLKEGWYRFGGFAGSAMPTECVPTNRCGGLAPGWLQGSHPSKRFQIVKRTVCFHWDNNCCRIKDPRIRVLNCGGFFVYYLFRTRPFTTESENICSLRYCGNNNTGVTVPGSDRPTATSSTNETQGPPRIIDMQVVRLVSKNNDKFFIRCKISGARPMYVFWFMYKDGVKTSLLKTVATTLNELEIATAGVYECQVENLRGTFSKEITVSPQEFEKLMALNQKEEIKSSARVNLTLLGLVVGFSFIIIVLFVVVAFLCWKMKKQQKVESAEAVKQPSLNKQNESTKKGSNSFTQNNLKQNINRSPQPLPPESSAQTQNSNYEQHYMELQTRGQRSSNGYDYALHPYEVPR